MSKLKIDLLTDTDNGEHRVTFSSEKGKVIMTLKRGSESVSVGINDKGMRRLKSAVNVVASNFEFIV